MDNYLITLNNVKDRWDEALNMIIKWNQGRKLVVFAYNGEYHKLHFKIVKSILAIKENNHLSFEMIPFYSTEDFKSGYYRQGIKEREECNIILITSYAEENLEVECLEIKKRRLNYYNLTGNYFDNREIIIFEYFEEVPSSHELSQKIYQRSLQYSVDIADFNSNILPFRGEDKNDRL